MKPSSIILASALAIFANTVPASAFTVYTDRTAWEAAVSGQNIVTETFDTDILGDTEITFDTGTTSTGTGSFSSLDDNSVSGGVYNGAVDNNATDGFESIVWNFPFATNAFAADFFSTAQGAGVLAITGNFDGTGLQTLVPVDILGGDGTGFLGIVGLSTFQSFTYQVIRSETNNESFSVDNFSLASGQAVPEPATILGLLAFGSLGTLATRRRK